MIDRFPLPEVWIEFYEKEIKSYYILLQMDFIFRHTRELEFRKERFGKWINDFYEMDVYACAEAVRKLGYKNPIEKLLQIWFATFKDNEKAFAAFRQVFPQSLMYLQDEKTKMEIPEQINRYTPFLIPN